MNKFFSKTLKIIIVVIFIYIVFANINYIFASSKNIPSKTKITSVYITNNKITVKWKKTKNIDGYIIYMSHSKNGKYKKIKTIKDTKTTKYTKKNINESKKYYFKIKTYITKKRKKKYSKFSNIKTAGGLIVSKKLTALDSPVYRNINLQVASKKINGIILKPKQIFKWSEVVGQAKEEQGYTKAIVYINGVNNFSLGGGICQVSTTLYQCAKSSRMKILERHKHGKDVSYIKNGDDATVSFGSKDFVFKNNKNYAIKIRAYAQGRSTVCQFYNIGNKQK